MPEITTGSVVIVSSSTGMKEFCTERSRQVSMRGYGGGVLGIAQIPYMFPLR